MTERILKILDNVRYWDTCPDDYKKDIEDFLQAHSQALRIHDVVGRSEQCLHLNKLWTINQANQRVMKCQDCGGVDV